MHQKKTLLGENLNNRGKENVGTEYKQVSKKIVIMGNYIVCIKFKAVSAQFLIV